MTFTKPVKLELQFPNWTVSPTCNPDVLEVPIKLIVYISLHKSVSLLDLNKSCDKQVGEVEGLGVAVSEILGVNDKEGVLVGVILNVGVELTDKDGVSVAVGVIVGEGVREGKVVQSLP